MKRWVHRSIPYKSISCYTALLLFVFIVYFTFNYATPNPLSWDNLGYHVYLSELIADGDMRIPDLSYYEGIMESYKNTKTLYQFVPTNHEELGGYFTNYTSGWTILNAPFIYVAHLWAGWFGYVQDGFSKPYQLSLIISSLFYTFIGLLFLRKICLHFFTEKITVLLLLILVLGTNYLHLHVESTGTIHVYLFTLYTFLIWLTIQFHQEKTRSKAILIGTVIGFMMLIRPTELLALLIPLLYAVTSFPELKKRFIEFFTHSNYYWASAFVILVNSLQVIYWKSTTGKFLLYTSNNEGEGLDFHLPHLFDALFSFKKGWFIYTPIMLLLIFGFIQLYKQKREWFWGLFFFSLLNLYLISCWTTWWYAESFSQRPLAHSYPIYILVIGFLFISRTKLKQIFLGSFIVLAISLNLFQSWQERYGILHLSCVTSAYYFSAFGQTADPSEDQLQLLSIDQTGVILNQDYLTPHPRYLNDEISVSVWLQYGPAIKVDDLSFDNL